MAYTKYSLTPANNNAAPPDGAPEGMLPSAVNDTMRDMMAQIRDVGDGIRGGTYTMTAPVITGGSINGTTIGASTASTGAFSTLSATGVTTVQAGTVSAPAITTSGDTNTGIFFPAADTIAFTEGGAEAMRIDSSGRLVVGATSAVQGARIESVGNTSGDALALRGRAADDNSNLVFIANAASTEYARIFAFNTSSLGFSTGASGTERMRIDSSGNLLVGKTALGLTTAGAAFAKNAGGAYLEVVQSGNGVACAYFNQSNGSGTQTAVDLRYNNTQVGTINVTAVACTYNNLSDYRLKTVIGAVTGHGERIDALEPVEYTWKLNGAHTRGFLAHQFAEVYSESVTGIKDAVDADNKPVYQSMQASTSEVMADLIAEIQSLRKRVAQLESK
jgi:hypothetical protein